MSIDDACESSIRAAAVAYTAHAEIAEYCNNYAKEILGDPEFEFTSLPDEIVETVFYGFGSKPAEGWSENLKTAIKRELINLNMFGEPTKL